MKESLKNTFAILQRIGKSLMLPVSVLPAAGLLVALGRMVQKAAETSNGEAANQLLQGMGDIMFSGGLAIFEQLPLVFAIGVAIGFTGGAGVAGLSAAVGYFTMINVLKVITDVRGLELAINTGVFGGIIIGIVSANIYKRFFQTKLHPVLGFFSGKRLVPIITAGAAIATGIGLGFLWPPIQEQINLFASAVMDSSFGPAFYAAGKRALIPVGLHHVYYPPFLFEFGEYITAAGKVLNGESARYFAGDPTAGLFMASEFPIMLFGLPAACFAMYLRADKSKRKAVAGIMVSAALTSIITGITEPIEFSFIFVAPLLYVFHVAAAFASGLLVHAFDIHLGYTFSASLVDYVLGFFNQQNSMWLFILVGPAIAALYFSVFYFTIGYFDFKTPGRDLSEEDTQGSDLASESERAKEILIALGGKENIDELDACITRLRTTLKDQGLVNESRLKELGAAGTMKAGGNVQVIFGTESEQIKDEILSVMQGQTWQHQIEEKKSGDTIQIGGAIAIKSPLSGTLINLEEVPDATFAEKILGEGVAILPSEGVVYAPFDGEVVNLFKTNHAIGLKSHDGVELLIHVGIDTVQMKGDGFTAFVSQGDRIKTGEKLIEFDIEKIKTQAKSVVTPIIATNAQSINKPINRPQGIIQAQDQLLTVDL